MGNEFTCEACGKQYKKIWSDAEAVAEKNALHGPIAIQDCVIVCDPCFKRLEAERGGFSPEKTAQRFMDFLETQGYKDPKILGNKYVCIYPLLYTHAIITGRIGDTTGYDDRWCYYTYEGAKKALDAWDGTGEPKGWHRHPETGRRVDSEGKEYVAL